MIAKAGLVEVVQVSALNALRGTVWLLIAHLGTILLAARVLLVILVAYIVVQLKFVMNAKKDII